METGRIASLVTEGKIPAVVIGIETAVALSLAHDRTPGRIILVHANAGPSKAEVKRRVEICIDIFRQLRGDGHWSVEKIVDHLPRFLRAELDGTDWKPEATAMVRSSWLSTG